MARQAPRTYIGAPSAGSTHPGARTRWFMFSTRGPAYGDMVMRSPERGSAMLVTMVLMAALLAGATALVSLQLKSTRGADMSRSNITAMYCAEAGLVRARTTVAANYGSWNAALGQTTEPTWLAGIDHDVDGDGSPDFQITLRDNFDDTPEDPTVDNDLTIYLVSTCTKYPDTPTEVTELVRFNGGGHCYDAQLGGCGGNANAN